MISADLLQQLMALILQLQLFVANMQVPSPPATPTPAAKAVPTPTAAQTPAAKASAPSGQVPFGGQIVEVVACCTGVSIIVGPPNPGYFLVPPGAAIYQRGNIVTPGNWVLGNAVPGGVCAVPPMCTPSPVDGTVTMIGTS